MNRPTDEFTSAMAADYIGRSLDRFKRYRIAPDRKIGTSYIYYRETLDAFIRNKLPQLSDKGKGSRKRLNKVSA